MKLLPLLALTLLTGCASNHAYMSKPVTLGTPYYDSQGELVRNWEPSQLTPAGCLAHTLATGGHVAWECRKPKARVCWSNATAGHFNECGAWIAPGEAKAWIVRGRAQFPKLKYWLESDAPAGGKWIW